MKTATTTQTTMSSSVEENQAPPPVKQSLPAWETWKGRAERVGQLRLLNDGDWLYRPVLQEPAPLTDQLAEQAEVLMQLGSDQAGSEVRPGSSPPSTADMESFKAANPVVLVGGLLCGGTVRWTGRRLRGSARMKVDGNMWTDLWEQARAVPAHRQKQLFDETREAEKIQLHKSWTWRTGAARSTNSSGGTSKDSLSEKESLWVY